MTNINIAIIGDGQSDYDVLKEFIKAIFIKHQHIELQDDSFLYLDSIKTHDAMEKYFDRSKKENIYGLHTTPAKDFIQNILGFLGTAFFGLSKENKSVSNRDIIIFNADSEVTLGNDSAYFEEWNYAIHSVIWLGIERFYEKLSKEGYSYENLPLILPIILFPCTEILVASSMEHYNETFRSFKAKPDLKMKVWGTDHIHTAYEEGFLQEVVKEYIIPSNLQKIYQNIPEVRRFIQILSYSSK
jgi:hypothetical protein